MHADFWISPSFGEGMNLDNIWRLPPSAPQARDNLDEQMHLPSRRHTRRLYPWWTTGHLQLLDAASAALDSKGLRVDTKTVRHGWSDMYYLPQEAWPVFSQAASLVGQNFARLGEVGARPSGKMYAGVLMNEAALPLVFEAILPHAMCKAGRCSAAIVGNCWGGPIARTGDPNLLRQYPCGHRMDLTSWRIRWGLRFLHQPTIPTITAMLNATTPTITAITTKTT